jgi:hypothetical protein
MSNLFLCPSHVLHAVDMGPRHLLHLAAFQVSSGTYFDWKDANDLCSTFFAFL